MAALQLYGHFLDHPSEIGYRLIHTPGRDLIRSFHFHGLLGRTPTRVDSTPIPSGGQGFSFCDDGYCERISSSIVVAGIPRNGLSECGLLERMPAKVQICH